MLRNPELYFIAALCVLANSSVVARPAKNTPVAPSPKQAPVRTDLTPRDKNDCLAVAQTLNEQVKRLSQQTKRGIPREFTRVASDLNRSCGAEEFDKAWISIDWMNGCRWRSGSGWNSVGVVSVLNLESSGVGAPERRPRHDKRYHEV